MTDRGILYFLLSMSFWVVCGLVSFSLMGFAVIQLWRLL